jgi:hypothetical protein
MKASAGDKIKDLTPLKVRVSRNASGVPRWVSPAHRGLILSGHRPTVRLWMTLFGLYRVIPFSASMSVATIITPASPKWEGLIEWMPWFLDRVNMGVHLEAMAPPEALLLRRSGPLTQSGKSSGPDKGTVAGKNGKRVFRQTTTSVIPLTAIQLANAYPELKAYMKGFQNLLWPKFTDWVYLYIDWWASKAPKGLVFQGTLGKLGVKEEPGKKRVFAMVDWWTQCTLKPLHKAIFALLKDI